MKKIFQLLMIIGLGLVLDSCYNNKYPVIDATTPPNATVVSFATDIQPIFDANCVMCHPSVSVPDLTSGNSYIFMTVTDPVLIVPNDAAGSEIYQRLTGVGNLMPPSGALSATKINLVRDWINQGALNN